MDAHRQNDVGWIVRDNGLAHVEGNGERVKATPKGPK
jgi:hypothetical protein